MEIIPPKKIKVVNIEGKGKGIVATDNIENDEVIEICPILILSDLEDEFIRIKSDFLKYYTLELIKKNKNVLLNGYGLLYNHSFEPNSDIFYEKDDNFIIFKAIKNIIKGEEITFNYDFEDNKTDFLNL